MKTLLYLLICSAITIQVHAQEKTISGKVIDDIGLPIPGVNISVANSSIATQTDFNGNFEVQVNVGQTLIFSYVGFQTVEVEITTSTKKVNLKMLMTSNLEEVVVTAISAKRESKALGYAVSSTTTTYYNKGTTRILSGKASGVQITSQSGISESATNIDFQKMKSLLLENETYAQIEENTFQTVNSSPLSTFSIDVDKASYSNIRRMINNGQEIPTDAVKIEEMINYFSYDYPNPVNGDPFSITTEIASSPWNNKTKLIRIGLKGKDILLEKAAASNLVFLLDVSGSMNNPNKLPLLKKALRILVHQLREKDKVSIVVYAGAAGLVLKPTPGNNKEAILKAINNLSAGGSTAGGEGIDLAYKIAEENFIKNGNNRVILATDGDFNTGASSNRAMEDLIVEKRKKDVFLTVLGFGTGNYKDSKMELLADKGNGNHYYIDTMQEANRVLGTEFFGTLYTIAKDVKIQIEFNPNKVQAYRLIGYENRLLNDEDFNDDTKDAGELGSGHTVTALYEIILVGVKSEYLKDIDTLKYTKSVATNSSNEIATVKFRYKNPTGNTSNLITKTIYNSNSNIKQASLDFQFSTAVALFGMQLRKSNFINTTKISDVIKLAERGRGIDANGYRAEFIRLAKSYR